MSIQHYLARQDLTGDFPHPNTHKHDAPPCARRWLRLPMRSRLSVAASSQPAPARKSRSPADRTLRFRNGQPLRYATCRNSAPPVSSPYRDSMSRSASQCTLTRNTCRRTPDRCLAQRPRPQIRAVFKAPVQGVGENGAAPHRAVGCGRVRLRRRGAEFPVRLCKLDCVAPNSQIAQM